MEAVFRRLVDLPSVPVCTETGNPDARKPNPSAKSVKAIALGLRKFTQSNNREIVAGGDIKWKPVDRVAARLLSSGNKSITMKNDSLIYNERETRNADQSAVIGKHFITTRL
jgi:hypothetical protein